MCELFGMSSRLPAIVNFSIEEFSHHGGLTGPHADGWGIAFYDDGDVRLIREPEAAAESEWLSFVKNHQIHSTTVISHIRKATMGPRCLKNTQPFCRELGVRKHIFAHNGDLFGVERLAFGSCRPVGDTDSERAFCHLLHRLEPLWLHGRQLPSIDERAEVVADFAASLREFGSANFLYSDSELLFAHGHRRKGPDDISRPPGLYRLCRRCVAGHDELDAAGLRVTFSQQEVALVASVPLTEENWLPLEEGEVIVVSQGEIVACQSRGKRNEKRNDHRIQA